MANTLFVLNGPPYGTTQVIDVRHDPTIASDVAHFLRESGVKHTTAADRILGCSSPRSATTPVRWSPVR